MDEVGPVLIPAVLVLSQPDSGEEKQRADRVTELPPSYWGVRWGLPAQCTAEDEEAGIEEQDTCAGPLLATGKMVRSGERA
ncbi:hypothetical protein NDU88_004066 [Pleurodeles waltl]|uniref:Uncharacterized protein n=1 Tax=Pleurodeles waltl TaxID=8319 RepID=A0AAV7TSE9_PLEWA|nr:hypothetical protein NDU88_004066 [Pleurodeles waltl]